MSNNFALLNDQVSQFRCPACNRRLARNYTFSALSEVVLWCAFGPCPSTESNEGTKAYTEADAFQELEANIEEEALAAAAMEASGANHNDEDGGTDR